MNEDEVFKEFGKIWSEEKHFYVLEKRNDSMGYNIMSTVYNSVVIIEDVEIANYVVRKMQENGVPVVDDFETLRNSNRPDPIFYTPELEALYRKLQEQKKQME